MWGRGRRGCESGVRISSGDGRREKGEGRREMGKAILLAMADASASSSGTKRHHGLVRLTHWLNAALLLGMIGSGLQIYGAYSHFGPRGDVYPLPNPWDGKNFPQWARLGGWL